MNASDAIFKNALCKLLTEIFDGPPGRECYLLNAGDLGFLRQLDSINARAASALPTAGKTSIAAHVDHVHYGFTLMNRWAAGEANPFATADWDASWRRTSVTQDEWRTLRDKLGQQAEAWRKVVAERTNWDDMSAAHTAYHLGAIRQLIAALGPAASAAKAPE